MIPRFSLRQLLIGMVFFSLVSGIFALAGRGNLIAYGLAVVIVMSFVPLIIFALVYWVSKMVAEQHGDGPSKLANSPAYGPDELSK